MPEAWCKLSIFCVMTPGDLPLRNRLAIARCPRPGLAAPNWSCMAKRRRQDSSRAAWLDMNSSKGIGASLVQIPPGERKSGIPHSVEIPAPVKGTIVCEVSINSRKRSIALCRSDAIISRCFATGLGSPFLGAIHHCTPAQRNQIRVIRWAGSLDANRPDRSKASTQHSKGNAATRSTPRCLKLRVLQCRDHGYAGAARAMERHEVLGTSETGLASLTAERIYFRLRRDLLAADLFCEAAAFAGLAIRNSSGFLPSFVRAVSHFGVAPLPAQVSPFGPRYFGATFMPYLGCDLVALARVRPELHAPPSRRCNCFFSS